jgi:hypothetical protein
MRQYMLRKNVLLALGAAALVYASSAFARPPIADEIGEFYFYYDEQGNEVGSTSMDCDGNFSQSGELSARYSRGYLICPPD